jgi:hypothetical protein
MMKRKIYLLAAATMMLGTAAPAMAQTASSDPSEWVTTHDTRADGRLEPGYTRHYSSGDRYDMSMRDRGYSARNTPAEERAITRDLNQEQLDDARS